ncbi:SRPBCC family protein [Paenibacillus silvae]|uniref:SRPBCC family protein n=1 Tax=Paenibacillus silvae TaxID=1325358 RepID=UPI0025A0E7CF|nr:SRPBCC family protein [Paenibacillus silvae]MDM5280753.1 SRPBCC family protein [Paenibacillus silvae]
MPTIHKTTFINVPPEQAWDAIKDVGAFHLRLVPGLTADTRLDGNERTLILGDGSTVKEAIVSIDEEERRLVFAVKEGRMPLSHHNASFQIIPDPQGGSQFIWITDFLPAELTEAIQAQADRVSTVIKQTIEAASK